MPTLSHQDDEFLVDETDDPVPHEREEEGPAGSLDPSDEIDAEPEKPNDDSESSDLPIGEEEIFEGPEDSPNSAEHGLGDEAEEAAFSDAVEAAEGHETGPRTAEEDDDEDQLEQSEADDGGVEGTSEDVSLLVDGSALPDVDADEDGAFEDAALLAELGERGLGREGPKALWSTRDAWNVALPVADVVASDGRVIAVGAQLTVMLPGEDGWKTIPLPQPASLVQIEGSGAVLGFGESASLFSDLPRSPGAPLLLFSSERPLRGTASASGRTWFLSGDQVWMAESPPATPKRVRGESALGIGAQGSQVVLLTRNAGRLSVERFRGDDGDWEIEPIGIDPAVIAARVGSDAVRLVVQRQGVAVAVAAKNFLAFAWDGEDFVELPLEGGLGFAFGRLEEDDAFFAVVRAGAELRLIALRSDRASVEVLMTLPVSWPLTKSVTLAWCDAREVLFIGGAEGMIAVGPEPAH